MSTILATEHNCNEIGHFCESCDVAKFCAGLSLPKWCACAYSHPVMHMVCPVAVLVLNGMLARIYIL